MTRKYEKPDMKTIKDRLTDIQYAVTQEQATEPPFSNKYDSFFEEGIYVDIVTGEPMFSSLDKFDSHCGWPSFSRPIEPERIKKSDDYSHHMHRIEVKSAIGDSHLGHVFNDGPAKDGGMRYCINGASLRFIKREQLESEGYGEYLKLFEKE